ncbi:MAG: cytochrome c-550 PedF [Candidatus Thiodiazotropha sp.]
MQIRTSFKVGLGIVLSTIITGKALAHGDVAPQAIDTKHLPQLGEEWREVNPYRDNADAVTTGSSAYNQNCARCHGLGAVSGGIAPDLRMLPAEDEGDEWFIYRVRNGAIRNGITYMPKFEGILSQEALWSIRAWLVTLPVDE